MLKLNNIEVLFDDVILVLKGLSLEVEAGQIAALLGAVGAVARRAAVPGRQITRCHPAGHSAAGSVCFGPAAGRSNEVDGPG